MKFIIYLLKEGSILKIRAANEAEARRKVKEGLKGWELSSQIDNTKFRVVCAIDQIQKIESGLYQVTLTPPRLKNTIEAIDQESAIAMVASCLGLSSDEMWAEEVTT